MESYHEKQQRKRARYQELALKNKEKSDEYSKRSDELSSMIPFGEPIKVGHHSENKHRNHIKRVYSTHKKSVEYLKKSEYYEKKVKNIDNPRVISSEDPEAVTKLKEKLTKLEQQREQVKKLPIRPRDFSFSDIDMRSVNLQSLGSEIRRIQKRINDLSIHGESQ